MSTVGIVIVFIVVVVWALIMLMDAVGAYKKYHRRKDDYGNHETEQKNESNADDKPAASEGQPVYNVKTKDMENEYDGMKAPQIAAAVLKKLNCQSETEEDGSILFSFQGATFNLFSSDESPFITIAYLWWETVPLDKLEQASCMQKAINAINGSLCRSAIFYIIDNDGNRMLVGSKTSGLLMPEIPNMQDYFEALLAEMFQSARAVVDKYHEECRNEGVEGEK